jgi:hypothetical protein
LELLRSLLFWIVFLSLIVLALRAYLREHPELTGVLRRIAVFEFIGGGARWLWQVLAGFGSRAGRLVKNGAQSLGLRLRGGLRGSTADETWNFINLHRLSPLERTIFYYLALLRRGAEAGYPRRPGQTPYEYSHNLRIVITDQSGQPRTHGEEETFAVQAAGPINSNGSYSGEPANGGIIGVARPATFGGRGALRHVDDDLALLTECFLTARYSRHNVTAGDAQAVRLAWQRMRQVLRRLKKADPKKAEGRMDD